MLYIILLSIFAISASSDQPSCQPIIELKPKSDHAVFDIWRDVPTHLYCEVNFTFDWSIWESNLAVYRIVVGSNLTSATYLKLDRFPEVREIRATFRSSRTGINMRCSFSSSKGILHGNMKLLHNIHGDPSDVYTSRIVHDGSGKMERINFIIHKHKAKNATCQAHNLEGYDSSGGQTIKNEKEHVVISGDVDTKTTEWYECFVNSDHRPHTFRAIIQRDVNECEAARKKSTKLCETSTCVDKLDGYYCPAHDYINTNLCTKHSNWNCPCSCTEDYMQAGECRIDVCHQAASMGYLLCTDGLSSCHPTYSHTAGSYKCALGSPSIDACNVVKHEIGMTCPKMELDVNTSTISDVVDNMAEITDKNPEEFIEVISNMDEKKIQDQMMSFTTEERKEVTKSILKKTKNFMQNAAKNKSTGGDINLKVVMKMNDVLSVTDLSDGNVEEAIHEDSENDDAIKFVAIHDEEATTKSQISGGEIDIGFSNGGVNEASNFSNRPIVAILSADILNTGEADQAKTEALKEDVTKKSDIVLITVKSERMVSVNWTISKEDTTEKVTCEWLKDTHSTWDTRTCVTRKYPSGEIECICHHDGTGTAALALAFLVGEAQVSQDIIQIARVINYICIPLIIIACVLFLLFCKFIGQIRLDQFNIAICILAVAIADCLHLFITPATNFAACTFLAVFICYFLLTLFFWYFIFGLNALMVIMKPYSNYHNFMSTEQRCLPIQWIVNIGSAIFIAIWFGITGEVVSNNSCVGPPTLRWYFLIGPIAAVLGSNLIILSIITVVLTHSYIITRKTRVNKSTHILVLCQLTVTMGIPYVCIYLQFLSNDIVLIMAPLSMALTIVSMFLLVAILDTENRLRLRTFLTKSSGFRSIVSSSVSKTSKSQGDTGSVYLLDTSMVTEPVETSIQHVPKKNLQTLRESTASNVSY